MKFSIKTLLLVIATCVLFTSCFEIKEIVHFNKDGSGDFQFIIDMSAMKALIEMAGEAEEGEEEEDPFADAGDSFDEQIEAISKIDGITSAESIADEDTYMFGLKFSFADVNALNDALNEVFKDEGGDKDRTFFKASKKKIERVDAVNMKDEFTKLMSEGGEEEGMEEAMMFFQDVKYVAEYTFDRKVKKVTNKDAAVSKNKVVVEQFLFQEGNDTKLDNSIKLK